MLARTSRGCIIMMRSFEFFLSFEVFHIMKARMETDKSYVFPCSLCETNDTPVWHDSRDDEDKACHKLWVIPITIFSSSSRHHDLSWNRKHLSNDAATIFPCRCSSSESVTGTTCILKIMSRPQRKSIGCKIPFKLQTRHVLLLQQSILQRKYWKSWAICLPFISQDDCHASRSSFRLTFRGSLPWTSHQTWKPYPWKEIIRHFASLVWNRGMERLMETRRKSCICLQIEFRVTRVFSLPSNAFSSSQAARLFKWISEAEFDVSVS